MAVKILLLTSFLFFITLSGNFASAFVGLPTETGAYVLKSDVQVVQDNLTAVSGAQIVDSLPETAVLSARGEDFLRVSETSELAGVQSGSENTGTGDSFSLNPIEDFIPQGNNVVEYNISPMNFYCGGSSWYCLDPSHSGCCVDNKPICCGGNWPLCGGHCNGNSYCCTSGSNFHCCSGGPECCPSQYPNSCCPSSGAAPNYCCHPDAICLPEENNCAWCPASFVSGWTNPAFACDENVITYHQIKNKGSRALSYSVTFYNYDPGGNLVGTIGPYYETIGSLQTKVWSVWFAPPGGEWKTPGKYTVKGVFTFNECKSDKILYTYAYPYVPQAPCIKCGASPVSSWVDIDGSCSNVIKTSHAFGNNGDVAFNYDVNFYLYNPSGSLVDIASNSGNLQPGYTTTWWVRWAVPAGGWKSGGTYTSTAELISHCPAGNLKSRTSAYPQIPGCGGSTRCDGRINVYLKDLLGIPVQGAKVYMDGTLDGTTLSSGLREVVTADASGCGKSHEITVYCPGDNKYCGSKSATTDFNGDADRLDFVCFCPAVAPGLDIYAQTDSFVYKQDDMVRLDASVKDRNKNAVPNVLLGVFDPFRSFSSYFTLPDGLKTYYTTAATPGLQSFFLGASKGGYLPGYFTKKVVVESFSAKIMVDIDDDSKPLAGSMIYLNNVYSGQTGADGKAMLSISRKGLYEVAAKCPGSKPGDAFCASGTVDMLNNGVSFLDLKCQCGRKDSNILLNLTTLHDGYPIANAYVYVDGVEAGMTGPHGYLELGKVPMGTHNLGVYVYAADDENDNDVHLRYGTIAVNADKPDKILNLHIKREDLGPGSTGASGDNDTLYLSAYDGNFSPKIAPLLVVVAVVTVASMAYDSWELYQCEKNYPDIEMKAQKCWDKGVWLALNFIPVSWIAKTGKFAVVLGDGIVKHLPEIGRVVGMAERIGPNKFRIAADYYGQVIRYTLEYGDDGSQIIKITDNAVGVLLKDSEKAAEAVKIVYRDGDDFVKIGDKTIKRGELWGDTKNKMGQLGEIMTDEYVAAIVKNADKGIKIVVKTGSSGEILKETERYIFRFKPDGKNIEVFDKIKKSVGGEIDRLLEINGKPVIIESKAARTSTIMDSLPPEKIDSKIKLIEELYGVKPEFVLNAPKNQIPYYMIREIEFIRGGKVIDFVDDVQDFERVARGLE